MVGRTEKEVSEFLENTSDWKGSQITKLHDGYMHNAFLVERQGEKYILHAGHTHKTQVSEVQQYRVLKFFEHKGITFTPKALYYDSDTDLMIQEFIDGGESSTKYFDRAQLAKWISQVAQIHKLDCQEFQQYCQNNGLPVPSVTTLRESVEIYGVDRFELAKKYGILQEIIDWITPKLEENLSFADKLANTKAPHINHEDIGGNLRVEGDNIWLLDWEHSRISYYSELAFVMIHAKLEPESFEFIVQKYASEMEITQDKLMKDIKDEEKLTRLNEVIWAVWMWGANKDNPEKAQHFKDKTYSRMALYEKHCE